ncbi:hypothetical protein Tco_0437992 [Tanacetum coccineum]
MRLNLKGLKCQNNGLPPKLIVKKKILSKPVTQHYLPKKTESAFAKPDHVIASSSSRNSSKNMPRFSSNDMVHNHYLDEARKKTQERDRNSKTSVMPSARFQSTADGSKPKPRRNNQTSRSLGLYLRVHEVDSETPKWIQNADITNQYESAQTLDVSAGLDPQCQMTFEPKRIQASQPHVKTEVHIKQRRQYHIKRLDFAIRESLSTTYFNGENQVVLKSSAVTTTDASNKRQQQPDSTSSTSTLATTVTANGNFDL